MNPSLLLTNNYFVVDEQTRKDVLNNFDQKIPLTKVQLKRLENYLRKTMTPDEIHDINIEMKKRNMLLKDFMRK